MVIAVDTPQVRPLDASLNLQRKAALAGGGAFDHAGQVRVEPMSSFDMSRTIFGGMKGRLARMVMKDKLAKETFWSDGAIEEIEAAYAASQAEKPVPSLDQALVDFMMEECDFSMEHADGTFLQHLVFCHDYSAKYFSNYSPNVALLHSILGTATNTFAMEARKLPRLQELLTDFEWAHVQAFPSVLRLFYDGALLPELEANMSQLDRLKAIRFHRVIDDAPLQLSAKDLWVNFNFHLMHFVDFMPPANWGTHRTDPLMQQFKALSHFLDSAGLRWAQVQVSFPKGGKDMLGEAPTAAGRISRAIPLPIKRRLAQKTIQKYSEDVGHSLLYELDWR
ncbi:MAG: hypothetical protein AAF627_07250 [Myxococcota bacterium]